MKTEEAPRTGTAPRSLTYIPALDGLRALAIVGVLAFHGGAAWLPGGFLGVDLFFVLSGWLITTGLWRALHAGGLGRGELVAFWGRRARRLLPAAWVAIVAVVVWFAIAATTEERLRVIRDAPFAQFYVANWHEISAPGGYWASFDNPSPLGHLWSLAVEEQFYLFWPLLLAAAALLVRDRGRALLLAALGGAAVSVAIGYAVLDPTHTTRVYMGTDTRAASLLLGAAFVAPSVRAGFGRVVVGLRRWSGVVVIAAPLAVILTMWVTVDGGDTWLYPGGLLLHSALAAVLVAAIAQLSLRGRRRTTADPFLELLGSPPMRWLGLRSYGIYLWHWPVFVWFDGTRGPSTEPWLTLCRLTVTFALAEASYRFVEQPIRLRARWARGRSGLAALAGTTALVVAVVAVMPRDQVRPEDTAASLTALVTATTSSTSPPVGVVAGPGSSATTTTTTAPPRESITSAVWLGESTAFDIAPGVEAALGAAGVDVRSRPFPGMSLTGGLFLPDGEEWLRDDLPDRLAESPDDDVVVWQESRWDVDASPDRLEAAHRGLVELALQDHRFVVFASAPPMPEPAVNRALVAMFAVARRVAADYPGRVFVADLSEAWGDEFVQFDDSGQPLRKTDHLHVCPLGAARVGAVMARRMAGWFDGVNPVDPSAWVGGRWLADRRYANPPGSCAPAS